MNITRATIQEAGSCNFCDRGTRSNTFVHRPYTHVNKVRGFGTTLVNICDFCLFELMEYGDKIPRP